jgi:hypothetical protein
VKGRQQGRDRSFCAIDALYIVHVNDSSAPLRLKGSCGDAVVGMSCRVQHARGRGGVMMAGDSRCCSPGRVKRPLAERASHSSI